MSMAEEKIEKKVPAKEVGTKKVLTKEVAVKKGTSKKKWFVIHARSGYEAKVKAAIEEAATREGIKDLIGEIMIPTEQVIELRKVVWPTREETIKTTGFVLIAVIIVAIFLWIVDAFFTWGVQSISMLNF